jgi:Lrp/AsnC family leucine-responsive transcriptional regulator
MAFDSENLLDATNWQILELLQQDARMPFSEIGRVVKLSAPSVAERVRRLEDAGIISGYHAHLNPARLGYQMSAIIRLACPGERCSAAGKDLETMPEVMQAHRVTGTDSWIVEVIVRDVAHLEELLNKLEFHGSPVTSIVLGSPVKFRILGPQAAESESVRF